MVQFSDLHCTKMQHPVTYGRDFGNNQKSDTDAVGRWIHGLSS